MNTILLQKILDILTEGLAHVGNFFKDLFVSDPQDGQIISYNAETGHWENQDASEVELDITKTFEDQAIATLPDSANNVPMKSLVCNIDVEGGTDTVTITQTGKNFAKPFTFTYSGSGIDANYSNNRVTLSGTASANVNVPVSQWARDNNAYMTLEAGTYMATISQEVTGVSIQAVNATSGGGLGSGSTSVTFTLNQTTNVYLRVVVASGTAISEAVTIGISLTKGSDTTYYPYSATTHTVTLSATVENGYIDVISGQGKDTDNDTDITCTPTAIKTTGYDNVSADCGDVSGEYYTAAADPVIELANITEDITSEVTKNTTDFSDILLKVSRNNKVVSVEIYSATTAAAVNDTFLSGLPKPAMNCKVLLVNTTLGEDGTILGTLTTSGELEIATSGAKSFSGLITYVAK